MNRLWPLRAAIIAFFAIDVCQGFCSSARCDLYDCCAGYDDYAYRPIVRCDEIRAYYSQFYVIVSESTPRVELPLLLRPNNDSYPPGVCADTIFSIISQRLQVGLFGTNDYCFKELVRDCKEMPVIEFGTESCKIQATIGCGNHSDDDPERCNDDDPRTRRANTVYNIKGHEFLAINLNYNATSGGAYIEPNCITEAKPGCDKPIACEFHPDKDGYARDFYVELKNKPGCVSSVYFGGCPGFVPVKLNAT